MSADRLADYRSFVEAARGGADQDSYLFDTPRCRFVPEPRDELFAPAGVEVLPAASGSVVQLPNGARLPLHGFDHDKVRRVFAELPYSYANLALRLGTQTTNFVEQVFSRVLFAPGAVMALEAQLPAVEIVRFPGSPYEVVRSYWRNLCAVRRRLHERGTPSGAEQLKALLLELHGLLLLGEHDQQGRNSFYLPASLLGRKRPTPGSFYEVPSELAQRGSAWILTSGARVSVPHLGGMRYWQLLSESVGDAGALEAEREVQVAGLAWGRVLLARAVDEAESRPWFLPPRPLLGAHFDAIYAELERAAQAREAGDRPAALRALAAFHYYFVRAHALPSGNQSLSMSFVNAELRRSFGIGIPHLLLDQFALRFELSAYQELFARAARAWSAPWPNPSERSRYLMRMTAELNAFVTALQKAPALLDARALIGEDRQGAGLALLTTS